MIVGCDAAHFGNDMHASPHFTSGESAFVSEWASGTAGLWQTLVVGWQFIATHCILGGHLFWLNRFGLTGHTCWYPWEGLLEALSDPQMVCGCTQACVLKWGT